MSEFMYRTGVSRKRGPKVCPSCLRTFRKSEPYQYMCLECMGVQALGQDLIYYSGQPGYNEHNLFHLIDCYTNYKLTAQDMVK